MCRAYHKRRNLWYTQFMKKHGPSKPHMLPGLLAILLWGLTFVTDTKQFTADPLHMSSLPMDMSMIVFMHILSKAVLLLVIGGLCYFLFYAWHNKMLFYSFLFFFALYAGLLLLGYPGYYTSDDTIIYGYATRYLPVYWHCYLTSLYYMVGLSLFPASTGPILLNDLCLALCVSYIFYESCRLKKAPGAYLSLLTGLFPTVLLSALMCFRPVLYVPFFLFFFAFLYFEKKKKGVLTPSKLLGLSFYAAFLCLWRSEGLVLFVFFFPLLYFTYPSGLCGKRPDPSDETGGGDALPVKRSRQRRAMLLGLLAFVLFFGILKLPQQIGEKKYYGKDYLIISLVRPLSVIVHRPQTYAGADADLEAIDRVIDLDYIRYESLSCSSYGRYNTDHNLGHFTETGAGSKAQSAFIKAAVRLILHNPDLYLGERLQLFLVTNGIYSYPEHLVLDLKPVTTAEFPSYLADRDYGYVLIDGNKRLPFSGSKQVALFLFQFGAEAFLPVLVLLFFELGFAIAKKNGFFVTVLLSLLAREAVIFLLSPAAFVQYSFPTMAVVLFTGVMMVTDAFGGKEIEIRKEGLSERKEDGETG